jgi:hypothetical protein
MPGRHELGKRVAEHLAMAVVSCGARNLSAGVGLMTEPGFDAAG